MAVWGCKVHLQRWWITVCTLCYARSVRTCGPAAVATLVARSAVCAVAWPLTGTVRRAKAPSFPCPLCLLDALRGLAQDELGLQSDKSRTSELYGHFEAEARPDGDSGAEVRRGPQGRDCTDAGTGRPRTCYPFRLPCCLHQHLKRVHSCRQRWRLR